MIRAECKQKTEFQCPPFEDEPVPRLQQWDPQAPDHRLPEGFLVIMEGSRRIGKSVFLKWLLQFYQKDFDLAIVMTETPMNGFWQPIVGNKWVHHGWNPFLIQKLREEQIGQMKKAQENPLHKPRRVILILDDIIGDRKHIHEDTELNKLAVEGRHFKISVCLTTQDPKAINPVLRNNCDVAVIFQQKNFRAKESVYQDFLNVFKNKRTAVELLKQNTEDHDCIVVENYKLNENARKLYFRVAQEVTFDKERDRVNAPDYHIGCEEQKICAMSSTGKKPLFSAINL